MFQDEDESDEEEVQERLKLQSQNAKMQEEYYAQQVAIAFDEDPGEVEANKSYRLKKKEERRKLRVKKKFRTSLRKQGLGNMKNVKFLSAVKRDGKWFVLIFDDVVYLHFLRLVVNHHLLLCIFPSTPPPQFFSFN